MESGRGSHHHAQASADSILKEGTETLLQPGFVPRPAFPHHKDLPAHGLQRPQVPAIPIHVPLALLLPEVLVRRGPDVPIFASVSVPETPVNEDHLAMACQYEIGRTRQGSSVQAKPVSHAMNHPADGKLGFGVLPTDARHVERPLRLGQYVSHCFINFSHRRSGAVRRPIAERRFSCRLLGRPA